MFLGDTLYVETEVLEARPSTSRPEAGIVRFKHTGRNQHGGVVLEFERTALIQRDASTDYTD
jgi:acyl dehydratase